jgi:cell division protein FtsQ
MSRADAGLRRGLPSAGIEAPSDKRFLRPEGRPGRGRRALAASWPALRTGILVVLLLGAMVAAVTFALRSPLLAINHIAVRGNTRVSTGEVQAVLGNLRGENLLTANLDAYRARLVDSPWVASVSLRRVLPSTVEVRVAERVPMALARLGEQLYLVDPSGVIIDEFGPQYAEFDLPIVDGLVDKDGRGATAIDAQRARATARVIDALALRPDIRARVSQLDVHDIHDVIAILKGEPALLHLGEAQFAERIERFVEIAPTLHEKFGELDYADMRFGDNVPVMARKASTAVKVKK